MLVRFALSGFILASILGGSGPERHARNAGPPRVRAPEMAAWELEQEDDMANPRWIGTSDGSWSTTGNWSTGAVPVDGDSVLFDGNANGNVTGGLNQTGVALARLDVVGYRGSIGTYGGPLIIGATMLFDGGSGSNHFYPSTGDSIATMVVDKPDASNYDTLRGYWTRTFVKRGRLTIANILNANARIELLGHEAAVSFVYSGLSSALDLAVVRAGDLDLASHAVTVHQIGGTLTLRDAINVDYLYVDGGTMDYRPTTVAGDVLVELRGGLIEFRNCQTVLSIPNVVIGPEASVKDNPLVSLGTTLFVDLRKRIP